MIFCICCYICFIAVYYYCKIFIYFNIYRQIYLVIFLLRASELVMKLEALLTSVPQREARKDVSFERAAHSVLNIPPKSAGPAYEVVAILDPTTRAAQKYTPIIMVSLYLVFHLYLMANHIWSHYYKICGIYSTVSEFRSLFFPSTILFHLFWHNHRNVALDIGTGILYRRYIIIFINTFKNQICVQLSVI